VRGIERRNAELPAMLLGNANPRLGARALVGLTLAVCGWSGRALAAARDLSDQAIVDRLRASQPELATLLEKGESLATAGNLGDALAIFHQGTLASTGSSAGLFERRECQMLMGLGRREEARSACIEALQGNRTLTTMAATARSLATGTSPPTFLELGQGLDMLTRAREHAPQSPQLIAAMCDIAESIGDGVMLQHCAEELEHIAPDYGPTRRVRRVIDSLCPPSRFWAGWLAIAGAVAVTAADAIRRWLRGRSVVAAALGALVVLASLALSTPAGAEQRWLSDKFKINDKDPESSVPSGDQLQGDPLQAGYLLQDLIAKAETASKKGDHAAAVKFYAAILKLVPKRALGASKMCDEFEALGNVVQATNACGLALGLEGVTTKEFVHFVHLVMRKPGPLSTNEGLALKNVINHVKEDPEGLVLGNELECQVAIRMSDVARLSECSAALAAVAPNDSTTLMYEWDLALRQRQFKLADELLARAQAAGLKEDDLARMRQVTRDARFRNTWRVALTAVGALILLGALVYGLVAILNRRRARATTSPPAAPAPAA
jgi:tetratricopeptide (TPR) repeat protein